jgi:hypothetical protein
VFSRVRRVFWVAPKIEKSLSIFGARLGGLLNLSLLILMSSQLIDKSSPSEPHDVFSTP